MQSKTPEQPNADNPAIIARMAAERCKGLLTLAEPDNPAALAFQRAYKEQADIIDLYRQSRADAEARRQEIHKRIPETDAISQAEIARAIAEKEYLVLQEHMRVLCNIIAYNDLQHIPRPRANFPGQRPITAALEEIEQRTVFPKVPTLELSPAPPGLLSTLEDTEPRMTAQPSKSQE